MANVSVAIAGGTDAENTSAVTVGTQRWGLNGSAWGTVLKVSGGEQTLTVYKSTLPSTLTTTLQLSDPGDYTLKVTVNQDKISVAGA